MNKLSVLLLVYVVSHQQSLLQSSIEKSKKPINASPTEIEPITIEKLKTEFNLYGNLNENNPILQGVDLKKLREFILNNSDVKTQSTYRIVEKFRQANGITM